LEEKLDEDAVCHQFYLTYTANTLPRKLWEGFGDFRIGGQVICTVKYAVDLVLLGKEETRMIDRLTEIGRWYGMEINVEKTKVMRILRQPSPVQVMIDQKQLENVE
jgi:hypothetical protein